MVSSRGGSASNLTFIPPEVHSGEGTPISDAEFKELSEFLERSVGISLSDRKRSLMQSRLSKRLRALELSSFDEYIAYLDRGANHQEFVEFINALTTNKTEFFREDDHFVFLRRWLGQRKIPRAYLWSAACSTGEEPYSLAILCDDMLRSREIQDFRILATDIDTDCLDEAENGLYSSRVVNQLPPQYLHTYFQRRSAGNNNLYSVNEMLRSRIKFRQHNLIKPEQRIPLQFDAIFLRNVLIYFSPETVKVVAEKMWNHLKPGGLLFVGHSESLGGTGVRFRSVGTSVYEKET